MYWSTRLTFLATALVLGAGAHQAGDFTGERASVAGSAFAAESQGDMGSIEAGKPVFVSKGSHPAWKDRGRIVRVDVRHDDELDVSLVLLATSGRAAVMHH